MATPHYSFLPYLRRGLVQQIAEPDALAATGTLGRQQLPAELVVRAQPVDGTAELRTSFTRSLQLVGPGDILSVKANAFIRSCPRHGAHDFLADRLAFVELYEEDFPWRYTPAAPAGDRLRPWIFLLVLEPDELDDVTSTGRGPEYPPFARLRHVTLPPPSEIWAWAHVQVAAPADTPEAVREALVRSPDACLARLIAPRRLKPSTRYVGLVVPTFEAGRVAGLGGAPADLARIPAQAPAWGAGDQHGRELPYYHRFEFATNEAAEFEELVRRLAPNTSVAELRGRTMNVRTPGLGLDGLSASPTVRLEGALRPIAPSVPAGTGAAFTGRLRDLLDATDALAADGAAATAHPYDGAPGFPSLFAEDPLLLPPIYGRWHGGGWRISDLAHTPSWVSEVNLDPRYRVAAGVGARIVQDRDDELVERAFKQLRGIRELEQARRESELAIAVGQSIFERHLATADAERTMTATVNMHGALRSGEASTIKSDVEASRVPRAAMSAAFKKVARPGGKLDRALRRTAADDALRSSLIEEINGARVSASPPRSEPAGAISTSSAGALIAAARAKYLADTDALGRWVFAEAVARLVLANEAAPLDPQWRDQLRVTADAVLAQLASSSITQALRAKVTELRNGIVGRSGATVRLAPAVYKAHFGDAPGKSYRGSETRGPDGTPQGRSLWILFLAEGAPVPTEDVARMASPLDLAAYQQAFEAFTTGIAAGRPEATPPPGLASTAALARQVRDGVRPATTVRARVTHRLIRQVGGTERRDAGALAGPVLAHPRFPDPLVDDVRRISLDHLLPNMGSLPADSITLVVPNAPFIEALLAGANHELARELLWREFPTDLRGSYFLNFWDAGDRGGGDDAPPLHEWRAPLGQNLSRATVDVIVIVIRGALVRQFPNVVVYAQRAVPAPAPGRPRQLSNNPDDVRHPTLRAALTPDTLAVAFPITAAQAVADPGWFLVFKERPGEIGFGMDDGPPVTLDTWDDINFAHAKVAEGEHISVAQPVALVTPDPTTATWGATSADMAYILFQQPFLMARHASELI